MTATHVPGEEVWDPTSEASHENPYPAYERLREEFPLYFCATQNVWALSRYDDVREGLRDWETFSSAQGVEIGEYVQFFGEGSIQELDPPHHDVVRKVLAPRFQNKRIREYEPMVRECAQELIGQMAGRSNVDLGREYTQRLPILTIFRMLGIPEEDIAWATETGLEMLNRPAGESGPSPRASQLRGELVAYMEDQVARRRRDGGIDDVFSDIAVGIDAGHMREAEVQGLTLLLIAAGMETTTSLLGSIVNARATGLVAPADLLGPDGVLPAAAIEEFLRWDSPAQWLARVTTRPVALHGTTLAAGERVLMIFASANRDPRQFERPETLILDRDGGRNMAFGEGVHFCLGMPLARLETRVGITSLLEAMPDFVSDGPALRYPSHVIRGFESIPVRVA